MAVTIDVTGHAMLSDAAKALGDALPAHNEIAERLLGLDGTRMSGSNLDTARFAVALQVNLQAVTTPDAILLAAETRGPISKTYRGGSSGAAPMQIDPRAAALAAAALGHDTFDRGAASR